MGFLGVAGAVAQEENEKEKTPMAKEMKTLSDKLKSLRTMPKGDFKAGAQAVREAHGALLKSMAFVPSLIKDMQDGEEKEIALADSRRLMGQTYALLCELEIAYIKKDGELIGQIMSKLKSVKKEGHKKYTDD